MPKLNIPRKHQKGLTTPAASAPLIYDDGAIVWVASHSHELSARYPNQWILVEGDRVIASSIDPLELEELAQKCQIKTPFITRVAPTSQPQRMVYAGQVIRAHHPIR